LRISIVELENEERKKEFPSILINSADPASWQQMSLFWSSWKWCHLAWQ